jgi:hypothetical protein
MVPLEPTTDPRPITPLAARLIGRVADRGTIPKYGSSEWDALPDQDPRRAAAVVVAAEAWRDHCSPERVAADMLAEMVHVDLEIARRVREASWDVSAARDWAALAQSPTFAELCERRGEPVRAQRAHGFMRGAVA